MCFDSCLCLINAPFENTRAISVIAKRRIEYVYVNNGLQSDESFNRLSGSHIAQKGRGKGKLPEILTLPGQFKRN